MHSKSNSRCRIYAIFFSCLFFLKPSFDEEDRNLVPAVLSAYFFPSLVLNVLVFFFVFFLPSCYLAELGQLSLGPHNSQSQSSCDGCGLGPMHSRCICGGLIRTSTAKTGREHSREKEPGGGEGGRGEGKDTNQTSHFPGRLINICVAHI